MTNTTNEVRALRYQINRYRAKGDGVRCQQLNRRLQELLQQA